MLSQEAKLLCSEYYLWLFLLFIGLLYHFLVDSENLLTCSAFSIPQRKLTNFAIKQWVNNTLNSIRCATRLLVFPNPWRHSALWCRMADLGTKCDFKNKTWRIWSQSQVDAPSCANTHFGRVPVSEFLLGNPYGQNGNAHHLNANTKGAEMWVQQTVIVGQAFENVG